MLESSERISLPVKDLQHKMCWGHSRNQIQKTLASLLRTMCSCSEEVDVTHEKSILAEEKSVTEIQSG